jgi:hypothetical protein
MPSVKCAGAAATERFWRGRTAIERMVVAPLLPHNASEPPEAEGQGEESGEADQEAAFP